MKKILALLLASMMVLSSAACNAQSSKGTGDEQELVYLYSSEMTTFNYYINGSATTYGNVAMFVDGLIEFSNYGIVKPNVAESWESSDDGLVWTFHLRDDVTWVDYKGNYVADVTAHDFVSAAKYCLDKDSASLYAYFYYDMIVNAMEYYEFKDTDEDWTGDVIDDFDLVGVKALDDYTLEYTLIEPVPYFMSLMNWIPFYPVYEPFLLECGEDFGIDNTKILYNGGMRAETWEPSSRREFVKNESYYLADEIYITKMIYIFNSEAGTLAPEMFIRGEVDYADISTAVLDEWLSDPERSNLVRPALAGNYSYFYAFNFDPRFDEEYEPDNWRIAVNNRNFRLAIYHAFNRVAAVYTSDPHNPENHMIKTVTPPNFSDVGGLDYTQIGALAYVSNEMPMYDPDLAQAYRDVALQELEAAGATFPIKVLMPYNSSMTEWGERCQVVKQNLERVLGSDFIDIIIYNAPPTGFLQDVRRAGKYAFLECNWGPDYADPETFTDPFSTTATYNWPHLAEGYMDENGNKLYNEMVALAQAERVDIEKRFELFAEAEAFLITEAFIMPYVRSVPGWIASYTNPFESNFTSASSISSSKMNNVHKLDAPLNAEQYNELLEQWEADRAAALKAAAEK